MKTDYVKKGLVVGIIFLFIGAGVYPAIAVKLNTSSTNTVQDEKSNVMAKKIEQLTDLPCNCKKNNKTDWTLHTPLEILCDFLWELFLNFAYANRPFAFVIAFIMMVIGCF